MNNNGSKLLPDGGMFAEWLNFLLKLFLNNNNKKKHV